MIYYSDQARETAKENISRLVQLVASIPGNVLSYNEANDINYYLLVLKNEIEREQNKINRDRREKERREKRERES
jgi:hypothetical protein